MLTKSDVADRNVPAGLENDELRWPPLGTLAFVVLSSLTGWALILTLLAHLLS